MTLFSLQGGPRREELFCAQVTSAAQEGNYYPKAAELCKAGRAMWLCSLSRDDIESRSRDKMTQRDRDTWTRHKRHRMDPHLDGMQNSGRALSRVAQNKGRRDLSPVKAGMSLVGGA